MASTKDQVWEFMMDYQRGHGMPPTMDDIRQAIPTLNYRSSVKHTLGRLAEEGRVEASVEPGRSRRHRAVPREGTDTVMPTVTVPPVAPAPE